MRKHLNRYIDGIMVDVFSVGRLRELITGVPYNEVYRLAHLGHNPFVSSSIPNYALTIKTQDKLFAGTDADFVFTLHGTSGRLLKSLPFNANVAGAFERGSVTHLIMEGIDVGEIERLTVEAITDAIGDRWMPESITVESKLSARTYYFDFNSAGSKEWVTKKGGVVTKFPS